MDKVMACINEVKMKMDPPDGIVLCIRIQQRAAGISNRKKLCQKLIPDFRIKPNLSDLLQHTKPVAGIYAIGILACIIIVTPRETKIYGIDFKGADEVIMTSEKNSAR
jgi:hypothetical protein